MFFPATHSTPMGPSTIILPGGAGRSQQNFQDMDFSRVSLGGDDFVEGDGSAEDLDFFVPEETSSRSWIGSAVRIAGGWFAGAAKLIAAPLKRKRAEQDPSASAAVDATGFHHFGDSSPPRKRVRRDSGGPCTPPPLSPLGVTFTPVGDGRNLEPCIQAATSASLTATIPLLNPWHGSSSSSTGLNWGGAAQQVKPEVQPQIQMQPIPSYDKKPQAVKVTSSEEFWQVQLEAIYRRRNPYKLENVPGLLKKYIGKEAILYKKVCLTYDLDPNKFYAEEGVWEDEEKKYEEEGAVEGADLQDEDCQPQEVERNIWARRSSWADGQNFGGTLIPHFSRASLGGALADIFKKARNSLTGAESQEAEGISAGTVRPHSFGFRASDQASNRTPLAMALKAAERPEGSESSASAFGFSPFAILAVNSGSASGGGSSSSGSSGSRSYKNPASTEKLAEPPKKSSWAPVFPGSSTWQRSQQSHEMEAAASHPESNAAANLQTQAVAETASTVGTVPLTSQAKLPVAAAGLRAFSSEPSKKAPLRQTTPGPACAERPFPAPFAPEFSGFLPPLPSAHESSKSSTANKLPMPSDAPAANASSGRQQQQQQQPPQAPPRVWPPVHTTQATTSAGSSSSHVKFRQHAGTDNAGSFKGQSSERHASERWTPGSAGRQHATTSVAVSVPMASSGSSGKKDLSSFQAVQVARQPDEVKKIPTVGGRQLVGAKRVLPPMVECQKDVPIFPLKRRRIEPAEELPNDTSTQQTGSVRSTGQLPTTRLTVSDESAQRFSGGAAPTQQADRPQSVGRLSAERKVWPPPRTASI
eukprot:TRINITY_DN25665_c0_g1_i1.p1 TRINITY_DN25665_c0_g1~~TRINITY_DN25665_c0_g1_i1.p1  ORF type:complete len:813 (+),score=197.91 TRINITY_DN25665_c0_g1_i1:68-2506(+)